MRWGFLLLRGLFCVELQLQQVDEGRLEDPLSHVPLSASACDHKQTAGPELCWCKYPQSLYPNWTPRQQKKSRILDAIQSKHRCLIRYLDVNSDGMFLAAPEKEVSGPTLDSVWSEIQVGVSL